MKQSSVETMKDLKQEIERLEQQAKIQLKEIKQSTIALRQSIQPVQLLKQAVGGITTPLGFKNKLFTLTASLAAGVVAKKIFTGATSNIIKKIAGIGIQTVVSKIVTNRLNTEQDSNSVEK